ncbi:MAG: hypothetical protein MK364_12760, partial [Pirellulales bacterium]|nr:hypothetical protein [Pirellulales bacterium]
MQIQHDKSSGHFLACRFSTFLSAVTLLALSIQVAAEDDLKVRASWDIPTLGQAESRMRDWLDTKNINDDLRSKVDAIWA